MYILQSRIGDSNWEDSMWNRNGTLEEMLELKREAEAMFTPAEYRLVERTVTDEVVE